MKEIRHNYSLLQNHTYLNSCSSGLWSNEVLNYRRQIDEDFQRLGSNFRAGVYDKIKEIKAVAATVFGSKISRTALIPSCSSGINLALDALNPKQTVLHLKNDYPSIIWPFEQRNFNCITVDPKDYSTEVLLHQIELNKVDILALSAVQYSNGAIVSPTGFRLIKEKHPELLIIVDGTQFLGVAPFDFDNSGIDLFVASAFKWLCSGYGNGLLFLSDQIIPHLNFKTVGYNTYKNSKKEGLPMPGEYFEPGHQDLLSFKTLQFQIERHHQIGFDTIQKKIYQLKTYARNKIAEETDFNILTPLNPGLESGIISVEAPRELVSHLNNNKIICSYNRGLRLGIHFYNNQGDIDQLIQSMQEFERTYI